MERWLSFLFGTTSSVTRSETWSSGLVVVHALADGIIAASFLLIPAALIYLFRKRRESNPRETALVTLFILFILACGFAHFASLIALWIPVQGLEGVLKAAAALLALTTAVVLWRLTPQLLRLPSRERLQSEVAAHLRTFEELQRARHQLEERVEERTKELAEAKRRFEIALRGSPIFVFSQDRDMRFTWAHNTPPGLSPEALMGKTDAEVLPAEAAEPIMAAKRKVMETGHSEELETSFELFGRTRSFYLLIEPLTDAAGELTGTISVAVDISERKANEDQLRLLLRELTHRSKNLLAVINAIARQTAARTPSVEEFLNRFSARLIAIGCSHDLLVAENWEGSSLRTLIEQQLGAHADLLDGKIAIEGEDVMLKPEAVQNVGLALHELVVNAEKFGSLSTERGRVEIHWQRMEDPAQLKLVWQESGGPPVNVPERAGFGRTMIENVVGQALDGKVKLTFPAKGVQCVISIPASQILAR